MGFDKKFYFESLSVKSQTSWHPSLAESDKLVPINWQQVLHKIYLRQFSVQGNYCITICDAFQIRGGGLFWIIGLAIASMVFLYELLSNSNPPKIQKRLTLRA